MKATITPESVLASATKVTFIGHDDSIPLEGTPHRATWDADRASPECAQELHALAKTAWEKYQVYSFGGAMLRAARIGYHASFLPTSTK